MGDWSAKYLQRWLVPLGASFLFFALLAVFIPYASGYGGAKEPIAMLTYHICMILPEYEYCLLVPPICAVLIFLQWRQIVSQPIKGWNSAWALILIGLFIFWVGLRAEMQYFGFVGLQILIAGLILWFWGGPVFRVLLFPWAFFAFTWPLPFLDSMVAFPLRMMMSHLAYDVLNIIGIPCVQNGTALLSAPNPLTGLQVGDRFQIDIADPCSGIHSLFALLMFSALFGYLILPKWWQQWFIFFCAAPLSIIGNLVRVVLLTIGSILFGSAFAIGTVEHPSWFHEACGFAVYGVAIALEFVVGNLLIRIGRRWGRSAGDAHPMADASARVPL